MEHLITAMPNVFTQVDIQRPEGTFTGDWLANFYNGYIEGVLNSYAASMYPTTTGGNWNGAYVEV